MVMGAILCLVLLLPHVRGGDVCIKSKDKWEMWQYEGVPIDSFNISELHLLPWAWHTPVAVIARGSSFQPELAENDHSLKTVREFFFNGWPGTCIFLPWKLIF